MPRRMAGFSIAFALQVVALVLAHDVVYLARFGSRYGEALAHAGHGEAWATTVGTALAIAAALVLAGIARLAQLGILVRRAHAESARQPATAGTTLDIGQLGRLWLRIAPRIALVTAVLLTIQENLERSAIGGSMPGPAILLSPEYPAALWITIAVGLLVALVAALFEWRRLALIECLRAVRTALRRHAPIGAPRPRMRLRPVVSILGRRSGLRAPPLPSAA